MLFCVVMQWKLCHHKSELGPKTRGFHVTMDKLFAAAALTLQETGEAVLNSTQLICAQVDQLSLYTGYLRLAGV